MSLMIDVTADQPPLPGQLAVQNLTSEEIACLSEELVAYHQRMVNETLGEEDGVLIVDGSDFPKHGGHSAGVAPQWCGHTGKKDNCQAGVFVGYASRKGATLVDRRLYLPECWFEEDHKTLWQDCQIPEEITFQRPSMS